MVYRVGMNHQFSRCHVLEANTPRRKLHRSSRGTNDRASPSNRHRYVPMGIRGVGQISLEKASLLNWSPETQYLMIL